MEKSISEDIVHIKGKPNKLVVFLHGYVDDAVVVNKKIKPLLDSMDNFVLLIPQSPEICEVLATKRQWYSMHNFDLKDERRTTPKFDDFIEIYEKAENGMAQAFGCLQPYVHQKLKEYKISYRNLYICGFSQGASVAMYTSLMLDHKIGGCVSFSGMISPCRFLLKNHKRRPNILLIHGKSDSLVRFSGMQYTREALEEMGCKVSSYAMDNEDHKITADGLSVAAGFICWRNNVAEIIKKVAG